MDVQNLEPQDLSLNPVLLLPGCATLGKLSSICASLFSHLENESDNTYLMRFLYKFNELIFICNHLPIALQVINMIILHPHPFIYLFGKAFLTPTNFTV